MKQASEEKAERIITAARTVLARDGYAATTIIKVAEQAGVSRGLVHYHFRNKAEMLARVVRASAENSLELVAAMFAQSRTADELAVGLTAGLRNIVAQDRDFFLVFFESWAVARQSPEVGVEVRALYRRFREAIGEATEQATRRGVIAPILPSRSLAVLLTGLIDGLALQLVTEPELIEDEEIWAAAETAIRSLLGSQD